MDIVERLRAETSAAHERVEAVGYSGKIMDGSLNTEEYKKLIQVHYLVHQELEEQLEKGEVAKHFQELDFENRKKMPLLQQDVKALSMDQDMLEAPPAGQVPALQLPYAMLGSMYVLEGATLGGMHIVKALRRNENISGIENFHYYGCYGGETGRQWRRFLEIVKKEGQEEEAQNQMVEAARATFQFFEDNFRKFL